MRRGSPRVRDWISKERPYSRGCRGQVAGRRRLPRVREGEEERGDDGARAEKG